MEELAFEEMERLRDLLTEYGVSDKRIKILEPIIENTAWMKVKLDEAREVVKDSTIVVAYDNGGGQKGLRENPIFKGYESLWKSYMSGMDKIISVLPQEQINAEAEKVVHTKTMLEVIRDKKRNVC